VFCDTSIVSRFAFMFSFVLFSSPKSQQSEWEKLAMIHTMRAPSRVQWIMAMQKKQKVCLRGTNQLILQQQAYTNNK
jgi:hypothetical protein